MPYDRNMNGAIFLDHLRIERDTIEERLEAGHYDGTLAREVAERLILQHNREIAILCNIYALYGT
jgi:hypothetical protein